MISTAEVIQKRKENIIKIRRKGKRKENIIKIRRKGMGMVGWSRQVWHKPSWRRSPLTPPQSCQNLHRTRK